MWDRALSHRAAAVRGKDFPLIEQPSYAPELNPVEWVFKELRAHIEDIIYPTIEAKIGAVVAILAELDTAEWIKQLTHWHWIEANLHDLPQNHAA